MKILGRIAIRGSAKNGFCKIPHIQLKRPNNRLRKRPTTGPSRMAPRITGICISVASPTGVGIGIKPHLVAPSNIVIPPKRPDITISLVLIFNAYFLSLYWVLHIEVF
jgi:hypothetical protein